MIEAYEANVKLCEEIFTPIRFYDRGALMYFAKFIEWKFPGFSVDRCLKQLYKLQKQLEVNIFKERIIGF